MSTITAGVPDASPIVLEKVDVRSWKVPIALSIFALGATLMFIVFARPGETEFRFSQSEDFFRIPDVIISAAPVGLALAIVCGIMAALGWVAAWRRIRIPLWYTSLFAFVFMVGFLTWAAAGQRPLPITSLLLGAVTLSVPLIFGALGGVIGERAGVVNVAIEGQLLGGAFCSALVASATGSMTLGLVAAAVAGVLVAFILAAFAIKYLVDQVIVGVVINVLVTGLTNFGYTKILAADPEHLNRRMTLPDLPIPGLSEIPVVGPVLFDHSIIVYIAYVAVAAVWYGLFHTKWGLRVRAVGEHPQAADTVGISVNGTRFWNVSLAGAIAGLGGAFFTLGSVGLFTKEMTAGQGYIALAAVIFGRWDPIRATLAALLFGFATNLQNTLGIIGSPVPSEFLLMLPYLVTIFAVAGLVGKSRAPAADGKPYVK
ncbi:ABC transporter permease [Gryllotalpicola protaetiae]|uniref:ABC transporter permease n=1 Tax=Gryllotalpicola protaetiae TaxID=2419771 RepID=A0A387BTI1_9MICO|nr:ABC transporter permease [Gryllotalpicola protaetiae]AYG04247.1 ABC transporter permease [Gryllotalpicola protaetiae]